MPASNQQSTFNGKRIVITRSADQNGRLADRLRVLGCELIEIPLIKITKAAEAGKLKEILDEIGSYNWIIFTSMNGVRYFFDYFFEVYNDIRSIGAVKFACIGPGTAAELNKFHLAADYVPEKHDAKSLAKGLIEVESLNSLKILLITGNLNRPDAAKILEKEGQAIVDSLQVYCTEKVVVNEKSAPVKLYREEGADAFIFTSSSAVESYHDQKGKLKLVKKAKQPRFISIGAQTTQTMKNFGIKLAKEAKDASLEGLIETIEKLF